MINDRKDKFKLDKIEAQMAGANHTEINNMESRQSSRRKQQALSGRTEKAEGLQQMEQSRLKEEKARRSKKTRPISKEQSKDSLMSNTPRSGEQVRFYGIISGQGKQATMKDMGVVETSMDMGSVNLQMERDCYII